MYVALSSEGRELRIQIFKVILAIFVDKSVPEENNCYHKQNKPNFESEIKADIRPPTLQPTVKKPKTIGRYA